MKDYTGELAIDIETHSSGNIKHGVHKYVEAEDFGILMIAHKRNRAATSIVDLLNDSFGRDYFIDEFIAALLDPKIKKTAYNAAFEIACLEKHFKIKLDPTQWECTMVKASMLGLPMGLKRCAEALKLDLNKDKEGKACIAYFSVPCKPTKVNGMRTRNLPEHNPALWQKFLDYCVQDVEVEDAIKQKISFFEPSEFERRTWVLDQKINNRGVAVDMRLVQNAIYIDTHFKEQLLNEAALLTGLDNPNSGKQLKDWLTEELGEEVTSLTKKTLPVLFKKTDDEIVKSVLQIKGKLSKTSVAKYAALWNCALADKRLYGAFQYYGAYRTGRFAGRLVQLQNLPKNFMHDLDTARKLVWEGDINMLEIFYDNIPDVLSQLIRTAFVPSNKSKKLTASDFSAIEARVLAWLAGEQWRLDIFNTHGKIYEASAASMFDIDIDTIIDGNPNYEYRAKGKVAELACGYQGGVGALLTMGALAGLGIKDHDLIDAINFICAGGDKDKNVISLRKHIENRTFLMPPIIVDEALDVIDQLQDIIDAWREANPKIRKYWYDVQRAAINAVKGEPSTLGKIKFFRAKGALNIQLPSGRILFYPGCGLEINKFGKEAVTFMGQNKVGAWTKQNTYGGKLVENITQAVARDLLCFSMLNLDAAGYDIVMHIHDEVVIESDEAENIAAIMGRAPDWAEGLPLDAVANTLNYFKKEG